jgi:hypothetical protein
VSEQPYKVVVDPESLCLDDMKRARKMLKGRNPWEILDNKDEPEDRIALIIWCLRTREDPSYTLEQAYREPMRNYQQRQGPPRTGPASASGSKPRLPATSRSNKPQQPPTAAPPTERSST